MLILFKRKTDDAARSGSWTDRLAGGLAASVDKARSAR